MAAKFPAVGQFAFKGNVRRAVNKINTGTTAILKFLESHPGWPVQLLTNREVITLLALSGSLEAKSRQRVPPPRPV
jgi:hypothetical protein